MSENKNLTPKEAYRLFEDENLTNGEIAERFDTSDSTVIRRRREFEQTQETVENAVAEEVESYGLDEHIEDEEPESNPYDMVSCPACGEDIKPPEEAGKHDCPECDSELEWTEDETR